MIGAGLDGRVDAVGGITEAGGDAADDDHQDAGDLDGTGDPVQRIDKQIIHQSPRSLQANACLLWQVAGGRG